MVYKKEPCYAVMREPLNLYKRPPSPRPEVNDGAIQEFGGNTKGGGGMGGK